MRRFYRQDCGRQRLLLRHTMNHSTTAIQISNINADDFFVWINVLQNGTSYRIIGVIIVRDKDNRIGDIIIDIRTFVT